MKSLILAAVCLCTASLAFAQEWTGAVNSDWNNPLNWSNAPVNGDDITISTLNYTGAMAHPTVSTNSNFSPAELLVEAGAILTINASLTTTDRVEIIGPGTQIVLNSGTLDISGGAGNARLIFAEQAHFEMNGGVLNVGQRLLFELGASALVNDGNINVAGVFALIDGVGGVSTSFIQAGGSIEAEEFGFENEAGNFFPRYDISGGLLEVGSFLAEGIAPGSGLGTLNVTGGVVNFLGSVGNLSGSTMNYSFNVESAGVVNLTGGTLDQLIGDTIKVFNGGVFNINANLVWNNAGVITGENGFVVVNANTVLNGAGKYQFPNLSISAGKSLTQVTPSLVSVNGDFNLMGGYNQLNHVLEMNGNVLQQFDFDLPLTLNGLIMNNAEGVEVANNLTITDSLKWQNGILDLGLYALTFLNGAQSLLASENSYAIGTVTKNGNEAFVFPVGSIGSKYRAVTMSAPVSASTIVSVDYQPFAYSSTVPVETPLVTVSNLEYWEITRTGSTDLVTLNTAWNNAGESGLASCSSISLAHWNNAAWEMVPSIASGICAGTGAGDLQSTAEIDEFGIYTIGFTEGVYQQAVTVCFGETYSIGQNVYASSGVYFDTLVAVDGGDSLVVTSLNVLPEMNLTVEDNITYLTANASGLTYQWVDCNNNYELIQGEVNQSFFPDQNGDYAVIIEQNGCVDTSACVQISQLALSENTTGFQLYPNPVRANSELTITGNIEIVSYSWYSIHGIQSTSPKYLVESIKTPDVVGVYILKLELNDHQILFRKVSIIP